MANQVNWDQIEAPKSNLSDKFLKLEAGGTYTVRLIKKPIAFWKYTVKRDNKFFVAITDNPSDSDFKLKHPELRAAFRLAILVLHREDSNKLKILEGPRALFENFTVYHGMVGIDPGSNESGDFRIKVICPNGKLLNRPTCIIKTIGTKWTVSVLFLSPTMELLGLILTIALILIEALNNGRLS